MYIVEVDIVHDGAPEYNSPFSLQCNGVHSPFNVTLSSYQWTDSDGPITNGSRRATRILYAGSNYYGPFLFNTSLEFQSLLVQDAGIYNCSMTIELTYPDNSTAIITNTTYYVLQLEGTLSSSDRRKIHLLLSY